MTGLHCWQSTGLTKNVVTIAYWECWESTRIWGRTAWKNASVMLQRRRALGERTLSPSICCLNVQFSVFHPPSRITWWGRDASLHKSLPHSPVLSLSQSFPLTLFKVPVEQKTNFSYYQVLCKRKRKIEKVGEKKLRSIKDKRKPCSVLEE